MVTNKSAKGALCNSLAQRARLKAKHKSLSAEGAKLRDKKLVSTIFCAFSACLSKHIFPGPLAQAVPFRAFGALIH